MKMIKEINSAQLKKLLEQKEEKSFTSSVKRLIKNAGFKIQQKDMSPTFDSGVPL
jgi:hypothetical protein